jgi:hypothetical protein
LYWSPQPQTTSPQKHKKSPLVDIITSMASACHSNMTTQFWEIIVCKTPCRPTGATEGNKNCREQNCLCRPIRRAQFTCCLWLLLCTFAWMAETPVRIFLASSHQTPFWR